jgi:tetratricopeptide (TPR) repeat protein
LDKRDKMKDHTAILKRLRAFPKAFMMVRRISFLFCLLLFSLGLSAQKKEKLDRANREFSTGDYPSAIRTLQSIKNLQETSPEGSLLLAVSQFHANDLLAAETGLLSLVEREKDEYPLAWFYLGRVYHAQHRFKRAGMEYKRYLRILSGDGPERKTVVRLLRNVDNGIRAGFVSDEMIAENMGSQVNSENDEYGPIPSPTGNGKLYFSLLRPDLANGTSHSDIVVSSANDLGWSVPAPLNPLLNTREQENLIDISPDGQQLFYYRGSDAADGSYLSDAYREGSDQLVTIPAPAPLKASAGDVTPFYGAADAVYFASRRPGGYGGLDLYRMERLPNGQFGQPQNLGPEVNGPYDEICPFVAKDGRTVYYSTNDPEYSVGGFDVVRTFRVLGTTNQFTRPENAGMPLNSAGDDTHFRLAPDTFTGFLASDRKDGLGKRDVYIVYFVEPREEMRP